MTLFNLNAPTVFAGLALALGLAACVPADPADSRPALPEAANDGCGARALAHLIGKDSAALATIGTRRDPMRVIAPGQPVTMDYMAARLNVELDEGGKIIRLTCG